MDETLNASRPYNQLISHEEATEDDYTFSSNSENQGMAELWLALLTFQD